MVMTAPHQPTACPAEGMALTHILVVAEIAPSRHF